MTIRQEREQFFYVHAGYSYPSHAGYSYPSGASWESQNRNHWEAARDLARAEEVASSRGWYVATEYDNDASADGDDADAIAWDIDMGRLVRLEVSLRDEDGRVLGCLGSVIVPSEDDPYIRVIGAELASEVLGTHQECHARVTCGNCGHAWCEACDPAPSALCHWCHGRGGSDAELEPIHEEA